MKAYGKHTYKKDTFSLACHNARGSCGFAGGLPVTIIVKQNADNIADPANDDFAIQSTSVL